MSDVDGEKVRTAVRDHYGKVAELNEPGCAPGCCGAGAQSSLRLGYSEEDLAALPAGGGPGVGGGGPPTNPKIQSGGSGGGPRRGGGVACLFSPPQGGPPGEGHGGGH